MCCAFIQRYPDIVAQGIKQQWKATCYARRRPEDSRFDPDRPHDCDLLLDQNLYEDINNRYNGLVPTSCKKLLGPKFALLRQEFIDARKNLRERDGNVKNILIFFGGTDPTNETLKALEAIQLLNRSDIAIDVVVGEANPHKDKIVDVCSAMPNTYYHCQVNSMALLMANADLAIGAGGSTTWERCCLGLPATIVTIAGNQRGFTQALANMHAIIYAGERTAVNVANLLCCIEGALGEQKVLARMSEIGQALVDGRGVDRVTLFMGGRFSVSVVSDASSWIAPYVDNLREGLEREDHSVKVVSDVNDLPEGDIAFYLGCGQLANRSILGRNTHNLVVHESALPEGKGWSPLTWQILDGKNSIPITLFEAAEAVDSGPIYIQDVLQFEGHELVDELREAQGSMTVDLCMRFISNYQDIVLGAREQKGSETFYPKRKPKDSMLDVNKSIRDQFNLLRVADNYRYPAFIEFLGKRYIIRIEKA